MSGGGIWGDGIGVGRRRLVCRGGGDKELVVSAIRDSKFWSFWSESACESYPFAERSIRSWSLINTSESFVQKLPSKFLKLRVNVQCEDKCASVS